MKNIFDFCPQEFTSFLERIIFDKAYLELNSEKKNRKIAQHCLFYHNNGKPTLLNTLNTKQSIQEHKNSYAHLDWDSAFDDLVELTKYNYIPIDVISSFKEILTLKEKNNHKIRKMIITIANEEQVYVKFKSEDTKVNYGRNRLTRKYGSDNFLVVQLETPFLSLTDKFRTQDPTTTEFKLEEQEYLVAARQLNLFAQIGEDQMIDITPKSLRDGVTADRMNRYNQSVSKIDEFLKKISIFGKKFKLLLTTTAGIHKQKYLFTSSKRRDILSWAFTSDSLMKMSSTPIKLSLRLALLNSNSISTEMEPTFLVEKDIISEGHVHDRPMKPEWILNDGCGKISLSYAKKVADYLREIPKINLKVPKKVKYENDGSYQHEWECLNILEPLPNSCPSAFQIRFGGSKGMLVAMPDTEMMGKDIIFTESMVKFQSPNEYLEHRTLEVMGISVPSPLVNLNNEIIDILSGCSGQKADELKDYLTKISNNFIYDHKFLLEDKIKAEAYYNQNGEHLAILALNRDYPPSLPNHALIVAFLISFFRTTIIPLHFPIPFSCRLYGVADYSGSLKDKQVYILNGGVPIRPGRVLLFKEPCFNKTDLQVFEAVECPKGLEHLDNVVVFSTKSKFSDPSKVAGSDLDGDKYVCLWGPELLSICENIFLVEPPVTEEPQIVNPPPEQNKTTHSDVFSKMQRELVHTAVHSKDFCSLSDLLKLRTCTIDNLGSNWTSNKEAELIGQLLSRTIDAPKNNTWVHIKEIENLLFNIPKFPDYHLKARKASVKESNSIRGTLFKECLKLFPNQQFTNGLRIQDYKDYFQLLTGSLVLKNDRREGIRQVMNLLNKLEKKVTANSCLFELVAFYSLFSKIIVSNETTLAKVPKSIVLCSAERKYHLMVSYIEEIMTPRVRDTKRYSFRLVHIIRNNEAFTPSYRVNKLILQKILKFYKGKSKAKSIESLIHFSNTQIDTAISNLSPVLGTYGLKYGDDISYLKTIPYEEIRVCIKFLQENIPNKGRSSYGLKHDCEEKYSGYCSNSSMIIALYMLGYGDLFFWQSERNADPAGFILYFHDNLNKCKLDQ
ncbi:hypothetical protein CYY_008690 [Polysphondylium violaceum]|uniref:RNA-dependent RNA polymerase n=1 Tax=Polysphondylium violaceum TaxID=133409 RepID=A0A8J4UX34_9MYCE|nr:hypothetical protein CYY_008690 [Polysphondylium violaceum]